jgi:hypothetical protein
VKTQQSLRCAKPKPEKSENVKVIARNEAIPEKSENTIDIALYEANSRKSKHTTVRKES